MIKGKTPVGRTKHRPTPVQVTSEKTPNLDQSNEKTPEKAPGASERLRRVVSRESCAPRIRP